MSVLTNPAIDVKVTKDLEVLTCSCLCFQYTNGGPIIAFQVENEYGSFSQETAHLKFIKNVSCVLR